MLAYQDIMFIYCHKSHNIVNPTNPRNTTVEHPKTGGQIRFGLLQNCTNCHVYIFTYSNYITLSPLIWKLLQKLNEMYTLSVFQIKPANKVLAFIPNCFSVFNDQFERVRAHFVYIKRNQVICFLVLFMRLFVREYLLSITALIY